MNLYTIYPSIPLPSKPVTILGIESTAHTFGVGIVRSPPFRILADKRSKYVPPSGGIKPRDAVEHMVKNAPKTLEEALREAGLEIDEIDAVAVALGPGLGPTLRVGATLGRALASYYNKPLIPVNHAVAHIEIGKVLCGMNDPLVVYVSGGNTTIAITGYQRYLVIGETMDIALGNALDVFSREIGIAPPYIVNGMHAVDLCSKNGKYVKGILPYTVKGQDMSYSGLLTAALRLFKKGAVKLEDLCFTYREIAFSQLAEAADRALGVSGKRQVLLVGGVAANDELSRKLQVMSEERGCSYCRVPKRYAGDNGVMIAWTGFLSYIYGVTVPPMNAYIKQRWRLDKVEVPWNTAS
ncbi:MAG: N(6)-L-threonylcarbamoyladenine synthase Kae1 [Desulfurococcales archaeon]|nr:N(6)-L-threonylcarbamoyladenine synthase Kae1 [Desulfurococcales archaeon]